MEYVPDEVSQRDYISDEDLLKVVENLEQQQSGGGAGEVIHFGSNMEYVPDEVLQRDYISDEDLLKVVEDIEQQQSGGGAGGSGEESSEGFFYFKRVPFREKTAKSYGIKRTSYHLNLENPQSTFPVGHRNIIRAFEEGLANSIRDLIVGLPDHDRIQIYIGSNRLRNSHTTANVSVEQWRDPMGASRQVLSNISNLLNSNENFEIDDTLQLDVTHITMPPPGSGLPKGKRKRHCFGSDNYGDFLKAKRSVIRIMNDDELCCARAIIVAKAIVDDHPQVKSIKDSRKPLQKQLAQQLQEEARVPLGPCGLDQIKLFEIILCDYQFVVISAEHGHSIVHKGPESNKQIKLLMHDGHFDVITKNPSSSTLTITAFDARKHTLMKNTVITHAVEPNVMPAFSSIVATKNFSSIQRNQN